MRRLCVLCVLFAFCVTAAADPLDRLLDALNSGRLSFDYSFTSADRPVSAGGGHALVQGMAYLLTGGGLEIYCDGNMVVSLDRENREAVIETPQQDDLTLSFFYELGDSFRRISARETIYSGRQAVEYVLEPLNRGEVAGVTLYMARTGIVVYGVSLSLRSYGRTDFVFSSFDILQAGDIGDFRVDLKNLGSSFVVTDLR